MYSGGLQMDGLCHIDLGSVCWDARSQIEGLEGGQSTLVGKEKGV